MLKYFLILVLLFSCSFAVAQYIDGKHAQDGQRVIIMVVPQTTYSYISQGNSLSFGSAALRLLLSQDNRYNHNNRQDYRYQDYRYQDYRYQDYNNQHGYNTPNGHHRATARDNGRHPSTPRYNEQRRGYRGNSPDRKKSR